MKKLCCLITVIAAINLIAFSTFAEEPIFKGVPKVTLELANLDESGDLIYFGIDFAVFSDPDGDGIFTVVDGKVKRFITSYKNMTIDLGASSGYKKGVPHKCAMRTLYVPVGTRQEPIIIANQGNGKDGWVEIPNSDFIPTYFAKQTSALIEHTDRWDKNRTAYNTGKENAGLAIEKRAYNTFWSGEKLLVYLETNEQVPKIRATLQGIYKANGDKYIQNLGLKSVNPNITGGGIYTGEIWDAGMVNKWGNHTAKDVSVTFDIVSGSGITEEILETSKTTITFDNRQLFYRPYRKY